MCIGHPNISPSVVQSVSKQCSGLHPTLYTNGNRDRSSFSHVRNGKLSALVSADAGKPVNAAQLPAAPGSLCLYLP